MEIKMIPVDKIRPSPFQPRETFDKEKIEELANSIKESDLIQPIIVRKDGDTYQIIAGERRWRAYQFAGLKEIPVIEKETDDIETMELSLIENWHRLRLDPNETERFITKLYEEGKKAGRYTSISDIAKKTGIPQPTLQEIILSHQEKEKLGITGDTLSYTDLRETRVLKNDEALRKKILKLREKGKLTRDQLREFSIVAKEVSEPVREALLKEESKLTAKEAKIIDIELTTSYEKERAIRMLEEEKSSDRIVHIIRFAEEKPSDLEMIKQIDTGVIWTCPICKKKFRLLHIEPTNSHRFEEVME